MLKVLGYSAIGTFVVGAIGVIGVGIVMWLARPDDTLGNLISSTVGGLFGTIVGFFAGFAWGYYKVVTGPSPNPT